MPVVLQHALLAGQSLAPAATNCLNLLKSGKMQRITARVKEATWHLYILKKKMTLLQVLVWEENKSNKSQQRKERSLGHGSEGNVQNPPGYGLMEQNSLGVLKILIGRLFL